MNDADFLRHLSETPADDTLRLAYADWLEDQGDPRARFLRRELEIVRRATARHLYAVGDFIPFADWNRLAEPHPQAWVAEVATPCNLWLLKIPRSKHQTVVGPLRDSLKLDLMQTIRRLLELPCQAVLQASLGQISAWLQRAGLYRDPLNPDPMGLWHMKIWIERWQPDANETS